MGIKEHTLSAHQIQHYKHKYWLLWLQLVTTVTPGYYGYTWLLRLHVTCS